jgi:hypothetical protein
VPGFDDATRERRLWDVETAIAPAGGGKVRSRTPPACAA